ncbi:hypothetical protein QI193_11455 [Staphylococcus saprophyticus]|jgi:uncharacterized protein YciI|uniref:hypothetical protein n=1 Tax=Staphylococcus saprophyticus TaxID=29385 RepID=UPI0011AAEBF9|nr:hypothetical protein [Staphylococcus saprophyticus]MDW3803002.1 hypothetical protein [Staphylococcus saprophyticus]MDW3893493.1 hypothetical protein [Staphylococcus saprophyticus]MDW3958285.1 hypothetical protein [Staphylococcus saprophyticus]MDW4177010.1 hypothetical protein [Staphylococcus saprophyticus]MVA84894.1 hypothetical protein [Staphylococcus saprophyticus]
MGINEIYYYLKEAYEENKIFDMAVTNEELKLINTLQEQGKIEYIGPHYEDESAYLTIIEVK